MAWRPGAKISRTDTSGKLATASGGLQRLQESVTQSGVAVVDSFLFLRPKSCYKASRPSLAGGARTFAGPLASLSVR